MSLEAALQEHTQVMRELLARLSAGAIATGAPTAVDHPTNAAEAVADAKARAAAAKAKDEQEAKEKAADTPAIDYVTQVRPRLVKVSTTVGRDKLEALLAEFGVAKGDQLKPAQYADVIAAAEKLIPVEV